MEGSRCLLGSELCWAAWRPYELPNAVLRLAELCARSTRDSAPPGTARHDDRRVCPGTAASRVRSPFSLLNALLNRAAAPPLSPASLLEAIGCLVVDIADKLWQIGVPQLLPDRQILARMIPVMIDHPLQQVAKGEVEGLSIDHKCARLHQVGGCKVIEPGVGRAGDRVPSLPDISERRGTRRRTVGELVVKVGHEDAILAPPEPVALFLP